MGIKVFARDPIREWNDHVLLVNAAKRYTKTFDSTLAVSGDNVEINGVSLRYFMDEERGRKALRIAKGAAHQDTNVSVRAKGGWRVDEGLLYAALVKHVTTRVQGNASSLS